MKTKVVIFISIILMLIFGTVTAFAAEPSEFTEAVTEEADNKASTEEAKNETNVFEEIYGFAKKNAGEITSMLSFISSLVLVFAFRNGLFPFLKTSMKAIVSKIGDIQKEAKEKIGESQKLAEIVETRLLEAEKIFTSLHERLLCAEEKMLAVEKLHTDAECTKNVILAEVELLYEIFMSSSLPQYQKEAVGEKIHEMKKKIATGNENE